MRRLRGSSWPRRVFTELSRRERRAEIKTTHRPRYHFYRTQALDRMASGGRRTNEVSSVNDKP
jgi:hypothetical protein